MAKERTQPKIFYCVKCREKVLIKEYHETRLKNGSKALVAKCPNCGTRLYRIVSRK
jgi:transcription elongation factor Elf1